MHKLKILLIDDEMEFVSALAKRLEMRGFLVEIENNGGDGLIKLEEQAFDMLILDILMPSIGLEPCRYLILNF